MKIQISVAIRFSLISESNSAAFDRGQSMGYEAHKNKILSEENIQFRLKVFKKICLPSLCEMYENIQKGDKKGTNFTVYLVTSELLNEKCKQSILNICEEHPFIQVEFQSESEANIKRPLMRQLKRMKDKTLFVTLRMDDDDAISNDFYSQLRPYLKEQFAGYAVSFGMGYGMVINNQAEIQGFYALYKPKIAIGLAYISLYDPAIGLNKYNTVYCLAAHTRVDTRVPTIIDSRKHSFLRTVHTYSDLYSDAERFQSASETIDKNITTDTLKDKFRI